MASSSRLYGSDSRFTNNGKRDVYANYGYPNFILERSYWDKYLRGGIARRLVNIYPTACWGKMPTIYDKSLAKPETRFEKEFIKLSRRFKLLEKLEMLDKLTGVGFYGGLYLRTKYDALSPFINGEEIIDLLPYSSYSLVVREYEKQMSNNPFGKPLRYSLYPRVLYENLYFNTRGQRPAHGQIDIHASRIIHVVEDPIDNSPYGTPRLMPVWNAIADYEKVTGSSAEAIWKNSIQGIHWNTDADVEYSTSDQTEEDSLDEVSRQVSSYDNSPSRHMVTRGVDSSVLSVTLPSNIKEYAEVQESVIAGASGAPKRMLFGSERAKLASNQDRTEWLEKVSTRQTGFCEYNILRPFVDKMIEIGYLPQPINGEYSVKWGNVEYLTASEKAANAQMLAQAIGNYSNSSKEGESNKSESVVPLDEFRKSILKLDLE